MVRRNALIAALALAGALAGHWAALGWLAQNLQSPARLHPMAEPMLTRLIAPVAPPPVPPVAAAPAAVRKPTTARLAVTPLAVPAPTLSTPNSSTATAAAAPSDGQPGKPLIAPPDSPSLASTAPRAPSIQPPVAPVLPAVPAIAVASTDTLAVGTATSALADPLAGWPTDTRLSYQLSGWFRGELYGDARVQWQRVGNRYQVRIDIDVGPFVSLNMTSQGEVTPQGLRPAAYEEVRRGRARSVRLSEDKVLLQGGGTLPRPEGVQDTASQFVELAHQFASGKSVLAVGSSVGFWMARPGGLDPWTYDVTERVTLQTPKLGPVETFHLKPRPIANPRGNITAEMWFAPSLQYLPVRIRINQGPDIWLDLLVDKIEQR